jgi:hypothetical protein
MFQTGLSSSIFAGGYTRQASNGTAAGPSASGPRTATQAGFGTIAGGGGGASRVTLGFISAGTLSLGLLIWIWWSLPR